MQQSEESNEEYSEWITYYKSGEHRKASVGHITGLLRKEEWSQEKLNAWNERCNELDMEAQRRLTQASNILATETAHEIILAAKLISADMINSDSIDPVELHDVASSLHQSMDVLNSTTLALTSASQSKEDGSTLAPKTKCTPPRKTATKKTTKSSAAAATKAKEKEANLKALSRATEVIEEHGISNTSLEILASERDATPATTRRWIMRIVNNHQRGKEPSDTDLAEAEKGLSDAVMKHTKQEADQTNKTSSSADSPPKDAPQSVPAPQAAPPAPAQEPASQADTPQQAPIATSTHTEPQIASPAPVAASNDTNTTQEPKRAPIVPLVPVAHPDDRDIKTGSQSASTSALASPAAQAPTSAPVPSIAQAGDVPVLQQEKPDKQSSPPTPKPLTQDEAKTQSPPKEDDADATSVTPPPMPSIVTATNNPYI